MLLKDNRIFVVEDNPGNLAIVRTILLKQGASVPFDTWGSSTVENLLKSLPVDMILMDLALPRGVSGYDVIDEIRTIPQLADIPVVIVTAADPSTEMIKARAKGVAGLISKPIKYGTFAAAINSVLEGNPVWGDEGSYGGY